jgi:hypothetical protein
MALETIENKAFRIGIQVFRFYMEFSKQNSSNTLTQEGFLHYQA